MLKAIVSVPGFAFASRIACLKEPALLSFVLVTVNVCAAGLKTKARRTKAVDAVSIANRHTQRLRARRDLRRRVGGIILTPNPVCRSRSSNLIERFKAAVVRRYSED